MGSGMLPAGAYVTLEHEFILIFRKGNKREFKTAEEKENRRKSAYFWEERNSWFSDLWEFKGTAQQIFTENSRQRSGAFPFELAYRLINMFSVKGDTVLDPFLGTGTTTLAALCSERNSIGYEMDSGLKEIISHRILNSKPQLNEYIKHRVDNHKEFILARTKEKGQTKHENRNYHFPVVTGQERDIIFSIIDQIRPSGPDAFEVDYSPFVNEDDLSNRSR